jgi:spore coat protein U-like protein
MKKAMLVAIVAVASIFVVAGGAYAAGSIAPTVAVNGTVSGLCKAGTAGVMNFLIPDPSVGGPIVAAPVTDATVFCSMSTPFTVTAASLNNGAAAALCSGAGITGTMKDATSGYLMDYTFTCGTAGGTGAGFGVGKDQPLNLAGSIAQAAYINAPASDLYGDTVTLTISY